MDTKITELSKSSIFKAVLFLLFLISLVIFLKTLLLPYYPDFSSYYYGAHRVLYGGNPYLGGKDFFGPFLYPPFALLFFLPLIFISFALAEKIFTIISITCFFIGIFLLMKIFKTKIYTTLGIFLTILTLQYFPEKFTVGMGQVNNVIFLLIILFLYFYQRKRNYLAGVLLAISIAIKLFPLLLLLYLIIDKRWKTLLSTIITLLVVSIVTYFCINHSVIAYFFKTSLPTLINSLATVYYNQSLSGFLIRITNNSTSANLLRISIETIFLVLSFIFIAKFKKQNSLSMLLSISILITVNLMLNAIAWQHHFVWLLIPLFITFFYIKNNNLQFSYYLILGLSYVLMAANLKNPAAVPVIFQSHGFYGALLLYGLDMYLLMKSSILTK